MPNREPHTNSPNLPSQRMAGRLEAGVDEAGRGPLAGPVVAAAVVLPQGFEHPLLRDSKQLTETQRLEARHVILAHALAWNLGIGSVALIERVNILQASLLAMQEALAGLSLRPDAALVDGNRGFLAPYPVEPIVKGDSRFAHIAAASILAKTFRDDIMTALHKDYPEYDWVQNKGYATPRHRKAIQAYGPTPWHRKGFRITPPASLL